MAVTLCSQATAVWLRRSVPLRRALPDATHRQSRISWKDLMLAVTVVGKVWNGLVGFVVMLLITFVAFRLLG